MASDLKKIQELNDRLRSTGFGGRTCQTIKLHDSPVGYIVMQAVKLLRGLGGEHDFGLFTVQGEECFFRIEYLNRKRKALDDLETNRIITIGFASEM